MTATALTTDEIEKLQQELAEAKHQRGLLAEAIAQMGIKIGLIRADAHLEGPHLLMICEDITECMQSHADMAPAYEEAARFVETHVYRTTTTSGEVVREMVPSALASGDLHHATIAAALRKMAADRRQTADAPAVAEQAAG